MSCGLALCGWLETNEPTSSRKESELKKGEKRPAGAIISWKGRNSATAAWRVELGHGDGAKDNAKIKKAAKAGRA